MPKMQLDASGKCFISNIKNVSSMAFGKPQRIANAERLRGNQTPGPGTYKLYTGLGDASHFNVSTLRSPLVRTFYHSDRKIFHIHRDAPCKLKRSINWYYH